MARPKVYVRVPRPTDPSRTDPLPRAEGRQVTASFTAIVKNEIQDLMNPATAPIVQSLNRPKTEQPAVQVKTEQKCSPALGEKLSLQTPVPGTISSTVPGAEGVQATAPAAMWPSTRLPEEQRGFSPRGEASVFELIQQLEWEHALLEETEQNRSSQRPRAERCKLSLEDLLSDSHMLLKDKAAKLGVSVSLFKSRRKAAGLGRWPGRRVRAQMKRAQ